MRAVRQDTAPVSLGTAATVNLSVAQESKLVPRAMHGANTSEEGGEKRARKLMEGHPTKSKWRGAIRHLEQEGMTPARWQLLQPLPLQATASAAPPVDKQGAACPTPAQINKGALCSFPIPGQ